MLNNLKILLGITTDEPMMDQRLLLILENARARLSILMGGIEPPEVLEHVIVEAAVIRFNRIGSEGLTSHSVEGEALNFAENDFAPFMSEISAYLESQECTNKGRVRFL